MFLVLLRASSLLYTPSVLLGSLLFFAINACFFIHQKKRNQLLKHLVRGFVQYTDANCRKQDKRIGGMNSLYFSLIHCEYIYIYIYIQNPI